MNLLLDTHVFIWILTGNPTLSKQAQDAIIAGSNQVLVSAVSAWEIAIKRSLGKLDTPNNYLEGLARNRFTPLNVTSEHALEVEHLPMHHSDPFDRLLVAQARLEALTLVSRDDTLRRYGVPVITA